MAVGHQDFTQKKPLQLVYLELGVGNGGMLLAVSEEGFRFRAVAPVHANTTMPFAFSLDGRNRLDGTGTVEWVEEDGKSGGMRFTEVSPEFHATLGAWLNSDSSPHPGREVTPAPTAPHDDMEKIRQELRSGYPARPAEVTKFPEQKPERRPQPEPEHKPEREPAPAPTPEAEREQKIVARTVSDKNISEKRNGGKPLTEKISPTEKTRPAKPQPPIFATPSEKIPETREPLTANRLFPLPVASGPQPEKPAAASSAFLKPSGEARTSSKPSPAAVTHSQEQTVTLDGLVFSTTSTPRVASSSVAESHAPAPTRPYIPPLEDSFEQAWDRAKLTPPSDSPHLSRAAAGGIIAIALAVILGAIAYNFRQDIGAIFIQLGQSISGENRPAVSAPAQETKPETTPPETQSQAQGSQAQNPPEESGNAANPPASSADRNSATGSATSETAKTGAAPTGKSRNSGRAAVLPVVPPVENPPEDSTAEVAVEPPAKSGAAADAVTGEQEFAAARDILRGSSRQRDLYRAVILLWASVKKGHVPAEVTLADLYRRGDGVEKNCDQARVLLVAASKKGSIEARQMLEQIAERGCR